jgi:hypothetical protein
MATIPSTQKFHTLDTTIDTQDFGSAQLAAGRSIFTMQDILDTVPATTVSLTTTGTSGAATLTSGVLNIPNYTASITGTGVAGKLALWNTANEIRDSIVSATASLVTIGGIMDITGPTLQMPDLSHIVNAGDPTTKFGFANSAFYEVRVNGALAMAADPASAGLYAGGAPIIVTSSTGVQVNGNVIATGDVEGATFSVTAMNTPPASATAAGTEGDIRWTTGHVYLCTATNTWVRAALATF